MQLNTYIVNCTWNFPRIKHILGHKSGLKQYQKFRMVPVYFQTMSEKSHTKKFGINSEIWRLKTILQKDERVNQGIQEELKYS